jgi:hypothetical protein
MYPVAYPLYDTRAALRRLCTPEPADCIRQDRVVRVVAAVAENEAELGLEKLLRPARAGQKNEPLLSSPICAASVIDVANGAEVYS